MDPQIIDVEKKIKNKKVSNIEILLLEKNLGFSLTIFMALLDL
ncbi:hypothetical protein [Flavobacterium soyae]|uniref:Uncharacterized protein n=1 Tax=Flavobacterium soyae TaxID=2903098 RepID=A0ABZ2ULX2_9FLAO